MGMIFSCSSSSLSFVFFGVMLFDIRSECGRSFNFLFYFFWCVCVFFWRNIWTRIWFYVDCRFWRHFRRFKKIKKRSEYSSDFSDDIHFNAIGSGIFGLKLPNKCAAPIFSCFLPRSYLKFTLYWSVAPYSSVWVHQESESKQKKELKKRTKST